MNFTIRKIENQTTPTGIGTTNMYEVVRPDGSVRSCYWNRGEAYSEARYLNKYGEPTRRTSNNYGTTAIQRREGGVK